MPRILVVDDNRIGRMLVTGVLDALGSKGMELVQCASSEEAWTMLSTTSVDMVITDLHMGGMSGLQLIQHARKAGYHMPIVAVTMETSPDLLKKLVDAGATFVLKKPCTPQDLQKALELVKTS
jgi:two-component system chemotaxis response regulator CheY